MPNYRYGRHLFLLQQLGDVIDVVDLIVAAGSTPGTTKVVIVEVNNNPAMPGEKKLMSVQYRQHLVDFVTDTMSLALRESLLTATVEKKELGIATAIERFRIV